jgi:hypothetical protein
MTAHFDDEPDGDFLIDLSILRPCDISPYRASRLRRRCHAILRASSTTGKSGAIIERGSFIRMVIPALGAMWCLAYLAEIIRCTAAVYAYLSTQSGGV